MTTNPNDSGTDRPSPEDRTFWLRVVDDFEQGWRDAVTRAASSYDHQDAVTTWLVSLSAGAILAVGPALSVVVQLTNVLRPALVPMFGALTAAVVAGIAHRFCLWRARLVHDLYVVAQQTQVSGLRIRLWDRPAFDPNHVFSTLVSQRHPEVAKTLRRAKRWDLGVAVCSALLYAGLVGGLGVAAGLVMAMAPRD